MEGSALSNIFVGIDPGLSGGIAILYPDEVEVYATPASKGSGKRQFYEQDMARLIPARNGVKAAIEVQRAMPGQGVTSMFSIGLGYGLWRGMLAALMVPYVTVQPKDWRKAVGLTGDKADAVALAQRMFPSVADQLVGPQGGLRDGLAEALLIAHYAKLRWH